MTDGEAVLLRPRSPSLSAASCGLRLAWRRLEPTVDRGRLLRRRAPPGEVKLQGVPGLAARKSSCARTSARRCWTRCSCAAASGVLRLRLSAVDADDGGDTAGESTFGADLRSDSRAGGVTVVDISVITAKPTGPMAAATPPREKPSARSDRSPQLGQCR